MSAIKICGMTRLEDVHYAAQLGVDYLGFVLYEKSPRRVTCEQIATMVSTLRDACGETRPLCLGVFVNQTPSTVAQVLKASKLDGAQLSGDETVEEFRGVDFPFVKSVRAVSNASVGSEITAWREIETGDASSLPQIILDAHVPGMFGGTGVRIAPEIFSEASTLCSHLMLAGGITSKNIAAMMQELNPWGIDVASGVECAPGIKDHALLRDLVMSVRTVREAEGS